MKTIIIAIIFSSVMFNLNAQNKYEHSYKVATNIEPITLKKDLLISASLKVLIVPQFGGLFEESMKNVKRISNFKSYYDYFDFGLKLGTTYKILNKLNFTVAYNLGILKFDFAERGNVKGAIMKMSLCYNFQ